ncbi:NlpC/P60 family protein [Burkholderia gladioli]|uniref:NlpC/P60 family protein n=1 Tax=Burkholderia gladioli TaxID=28095 RepID=UPI0016413351|nr:NlpC/P60 family protein [Burkholderia gladioli]
MNATDANRYIGLPWRSGACGPDAFDCWGLLAWVQVHHFGVALPDLPSFLDDRRDLYQAMVETDRWRVVPTAFHGCGVLLRGGDRPHVGVYLEIDSGGVLHAQEGSGVVWTELRNLKRMGYPRASWYRL